MTITTGMPFQASLPPQTEPIDYLKLWAEQDKLKELATWTKDEYKKCKSKRSSVELQWYLNMSFYFGKQYVTPLRGSVVGQTTGRLVTPPAPPWRIRLIINRIRPAIRMEISKLTSQKPSASVVPASADDEDLVAAQAAEQIWESAVNTKKIHREYARAIWWTTITGNGFLKDSWDNNAVGDDGLPGDIKIEKVTPFHIFVPDLREEEIERQPYVMHVQTKTVEEVKKLYPDALNGVDLRGNIVSADEIINNAYLNLQSDKNAKEVLCYEVWLKPGAHEYFPNGGMFQVIDQYVVKIEPDGIPYMHGEYPFTHIPHIPSGKFYATSVIEDIISPQREFNRTRSQITEAKNRMAKPQMTAVEGSIDVSKITTQPGQVILYKPGFNAPQPLPMQGLPSYAVDELGRILADIEDITAQHQVSKGNVPPGVTAATAISYLQERDDSVMSHTYDSVEYAYEKLARHYLSHVVQYWDLPRAITVVGDDGSFDTLVLKGADIKSGTDIRMESGSSLPQSKAARQAFIMDMMTKGFISPEQGLRIMDIGGVQRLYDQIQIDEKQAQRENLKMKLMQPDMILQWENQKQQAEMFVQQNQALADASKQQDGSMPPDVGPMPDELASMLPPEALSAQDQASTLDNPQDPNGSPAGPTPNEQGNFRDTKNVDPMYGIPLDFPLLVPVNTWDNHAVHIEVHNRFRKGQAFEKLPPENKRLFEEHVKQHANALNSAAMSQAALAMGAPVGNESQPPEASAQGNNQFTQPGVQNG